MPTINLKPARAARRTAATERRPAPLIEVPPGLSLPAVRTALATIQRMYVQSRSTGKPQILSITLPADRKKLMFSDIVTGAAAVITRGEPHASPDDQAALDRAYRRGATLAADLLAGPDMLSSDEIKLRLGMSREAVNQKRRRGELLGLVGAKRGMRFPAWQLDADGRPLAAMAELHKALGDPWAVFRFLRQRHPELRMRTGLAALRNTRQASVAIDLARNIGLSGPSGA